MASKKTPAITKAIFPIAGLGTRFLPVTKTVPKELLPIIDQPLLQYAISEAYECGIREIIFVISEHKLSLKEYVDHNPRLENFLQERGKGTLCQFIHDLLPHDLKCTFVVQDEAKGLGHAILCGKEHINPGEFFVVTLPDDFIYCTHEDSTLGEMVQCYNENHSSVMLYRNVQPHQTQSYGIMECNPDHTIHRIVEKPHPDEAPSNHAVVGRYILPHKIFELLEETQPDKSQEIQITDAIATLVTEHPVIAQPLTGVHFDCGSKIGYLEANIYCALHSDFKEPLQEFILQILNQNKTIKQT